MISTEEFTSRLKARATKSEEAYNATLAKKRELRAQCALAGVTIDPDNDLVGHVAIRDSSGATLASGAVDDLHAVLVAPRAQA